MESKQGQKKQCVDVRPFKGYCCQTDLAEKLIAPPYDVLETDEAKEMAEGNDISFLHVNKPQIDFKEGEIVDEYDPKVYQKGKENLQAFVKKGYLQQEKEEIFYIYFQSYKKHQQVGIVLEASVKDYEENRIKRHEVTRKKKEDDRTTLTDVQGANVGPVFLAYYDVKAIDQIVEEIMKSTQPFIDVYYKADDEHHKVWRAKKDESIKLQKLFKENVETLYIADGHHRSASAYNVAKMNRQRYIDAGKQVTGNEDFNYFMALAYPQSQLQICDYNRVLKDLNNKPFEQILSELSNGFKVTKLEQNENPRPAKKGQIGMFYEDSWYRLEVDYEKLKLDQNDIMKALDVEVLTEQCLDPIFDIKDLRNDKRIDFVGGKRGLEELVKRCKTDCQIAFAMHPVKITEVFNIADAGLIMPPKSTWFEPKPKSGCVVRIFKD